MSVPEDQKWEGIGKPHASQITFTGYLLHVQNEVGRHLAIEVLSLKRAEIIHEYARAIHLLDPYLVDVKLKNLIRDELDSCIENDWI